MNAFTLPIPTYQCHKRVQALRIKAVVPNPRGYELHFEDERFCPIEVVDEWIWKALVERFIPYNTSQGLDWAEFSSGGTDYKRLVGCYVVWNEDGHVSISPAAAFETGYTLVDTGPFVIDEAGAEFKPVGPATQAAREVVRPPYGCGAMDYGGD